jgi:iron complex outermembrane receptor protein
MKSVSNTALLVTTAASALLVAMPAVAQTAGSGAPSTQIDAASGNDIIVTARRTEERLQDVPISITAFSEKALADNNINAAADLATFAPSLAANTNFGAENTTFAIRGFSQDNGTQPSVGVYFADVIAPRGASNGVPAGDGAAPGTFFDLQNVQILNGPQGTLQGRNTTGGAVLFVPQKPTDRFEGYVEGSLGNYGLKRIQGVLNLPLSDTFRVRLGVDHESRDGYMRNVGTVGPSHFEDIDYTAVRASIVADLTPNLENYIIASYAKSDDSGPIQKIVGARTQTGVFSVGNFAVAQMAQEPGYYDTQSTIVNPSDRFRQWQVINTTTWKASDNLTIKNIASYAELKQTFNAPLFGVNFAVPAAGNIYHIPFSEILAPPGLASVHEATYTEEFQVQGRALDSRLTYQGGAYLEVAVPLSEVGSQGNFLSSCPNVQTFQCTDVLGTALAFNFAHIGSDNLTEGQTGFHNVGLYAQSTYKFDDHFKATAGFRYTWDHEYNTSTQKVYDPAFAPGIGLDPNEATAPPFSAPGQPNSNPHCTNPTPAALANNCTNSFYVHSAKPTWLIDFDYTPSRDILVYAKYARGYRAGTIAPNVVAPFNLVAPEKVDNYEVGLKSSFHGQVHGTFNVTGFYNKLKGQQLQLGFNAVPGTGLTSTAAPFNGSDAEIYGAEVQASITPFRGLDINGGYTYLHTRLYNVVDFASLVSATNPYSLNGAFRDGDPEVLSPKNKFTINATYTLPLDQSIGRVSIGVTLTHRDKELSNYSDAQNVPAAGTTIVASSGIPITDLSYLPSLNLVDMNGTWANVFGLPVDLSAFVTNLTNKKYLAFVAGLGGGTFTNFETAQVGEPRMFGFRAKYRFGGK